LGVAGAAMLPLLDYSAVAAMGVFAGSRIVPAAAARAFGPFGARSKSLSIRSGFVFAATNLLMLLYVNSDLLLLSAFGISAAGIAIYGVTYRALTGLQSIPGGIAIAIYPRSAAAPADEAASGYADRAAIFSFYLTAVVLAVLFIDLGIPFSVFGESYGADVQDVRPLLLTALPFAISLSYLTALQARDRERTGLIIVAVTAGVNLIGNAALIPAVGLDGALLATTSAEWVFAIAAILMSRAYVGTSGFPLSLAAGILPVALSFTDAPDEVISLALIAWIALLWLTDAFGSRSIHSIGLRNPAST
jgi:O-antigen/teichoic acid export membrane protein